MCACMCACMCVFVCVCVYIWMCVCVMLNLFRVCYYSNRSDTISHRVLVTQILLWFVSGHPVQKFMCMYVMELLYTVRPIHAQLCFIWNTGVAFCPGLFFNLQRRKSLHDTHCLCSLLSKSVWLFWPYVC